MEQLRAVRIVCLPERVRHSVCDTWGRMSDADGVWDGWELR